MNHRVSLHVGEAIGRYGFGNHHPFSPQRMGYFWDEAQHQGLEHLVTVLSPVCASDAEIERFHTHGYVEEVKRLSKLGMGLLDHGDTPAFPGVYEAAAHVVGSALDALRRIMAGEFRRGFVPIAGLHHARPDTAAGFCVFNDCGVVIHSLRSEFNLQRVAYVDIDAHHGDGVFYAFESDPELIFADIHEDGHFLYPGTGFAHETGVGGAQGRKLNFPMRPGANDADFHRVWPEVERHLRQFEPQFILLQCGADSIENDPLTHMRFSAKAHGHAAQRLCLLAEELGHGRVLAVGGGGYNPTNIAQGWCQVVRAMVETPAS